MLGAKINDAIIICLGIVIEAIPFILLGVLGSVIIARFVSIETLSKFIPKNKYLALLAASMLGVFLPVCECGNIPVARRLILKGVKPYLAITFLLSAPVLNPIVIFATYISFKSQPEIVWIRILGSFVIAYLIGLLFSFRQGDKSLLNPAVFKELHKPVKTHHKTSFSKLFQKEFLEMTQILTIGAFLASLIQFIIPRNQLLAIGQGPFTSIITMILLAFITSICSTVDSFFALGFVNTFTSGAILAFLISGPMLDLKAVLMMLAVFSRKTVLHLSLLVASFTIILTLFYNFNFA